MGFYIRKALRVGPLRFNLSKSGIGVSAGVTGLRFGTGPRGNYVHVGRGGLYFRKSLNPATRRPEPVPVERPETARETVGPLREIDSGSTLAMADASSAELLAEVNEKRRMTHLLPLAIVLSVAVLAILIGTNARAPVVLLSIFAAIGICWIAQRRDLLRRTTVILYEFEAPAEARYQQLHDAFDLIRSAGRTWHIRAQGEVRDRKYHAGAGSVVNRSEVTVGKGQPPLIRANVEVPLIPVGAQILAFMPDRVLVFDTNGVGAVSYEDFRLTVSRTEFVENGRPPHDAVVVGRTWRYVNKKGGPDRRFRDNPEWPICAYEELSFSSSSGLNEILQVSRQGVGAPLAKALHLLALNTGSTKGPIS